MEENTHVSEKVLRFLLKRSKNPEVAQEVLQETWVAALKSFHTFRHKSSYFTWVCKIALNKLSDYYRDEVNRQSKVIVPSIEKLNSIFDPKISMEEKMILDELKVKVNKCLGLLPSVYRQLLRFRYYDQLASREICLKLKISTRSFEGKLYRAKKMLAKIYEI
ncbi:RNA polymerase sigma factor [Candidatus Amesbacteria bacterium]|nr:RNA polymerase sigma factor [Candidatus Amesbacteria bacterium]